MDTEAVPNVPTAPPWAFAVAIALFAIWWLWGFVLNRLPVHVSKDDVRSSEAIDAPELPKSNGLHASSPGTSNVPQPEVDAAQYDESVMLPVSEQVLDELDFEPRKIFEETFESVAAYIGTALTGPPTGDKYMKSVEGFHALSAMLNRIFLNWGKPECNRFCRMREKSEKLQSTFCEHCEAQVLFPLCGFELQEEEPGNKAWTFPLDDPCALLRALTVKQCLDKLEARQRARGARRWIDDDNSSVVPKLEDARYSDLLAIFRADAVAPLAAPCGSTPTNPSAREHHVELNARLKINGRRKEAGLEPLPSHEGLVAVARALAYARRTRARNGPTKSSVQGEHAPSLTDIRALLQKLPLPPGFAVTHLVFSSTELPRIFGLTSSTGKRQSEDAEDEAAQRITAEAMEHWQRKQSQDIVWRFAAVCGVGAALDYTINRGFVSAILVGIPGEIPAMPEQAKNHQDAMGEGPKKPPSEKRARPVGFGGPVTTLGSMYQPPEPRQRRPGRGG